jgi:hypothetical protein
VSVGRDYIGSDEFMRANIGVAREVVGMLNEQLPARVHAETEIDWSGIEDA